MPKIKYHECLFCYKEFDENNLIKLKCNCSNDYLYCRDCLFIWEQKKGKKCPLSWCNKKYTEEYFFFKKSAIFFKNIFEFLCNGLILIILKIFLLLILVNLLITQFEYLNNNITEYIRCNS